MGFVRNCWYAAAWGSELRGEPFHARIIGEHILLFRGEAGQPIALSDTCPHRFAPLHMGKIVGDTIECPYHGLRFNAEGRCAHNPFDPGKRLGAARVRSYPVVERDRFIWIWMGEPERADESLIPDFPWLNQIDIYTMSGEKIMHQPLNYKLILDNLMDLTHGQFLHPTTLGNESIATGTLRTWQEGNRLYSNRWNPDGAAPTLFVLPAVVQAGDRVDYWNEMRWDAPGAYYLEVGVTLTGRPRAEGGFLGSVHMLTPVDEANSVYRYLLFRTFAPGNDEVTKALEAIAEHAFRKEDEPMIAAVQARMAGRDFWEMQPLILKTDQAGILVRRTLDRLRAEEA
ncbi:aromatic ring-hydroxylating dioxygenase subunit alpha [Sandaracinobacter sp. RS1-74]|uniref:aromatic ring-hydroxylating dioxygenase subunit alpha n=1 Tax=Sandaracinobacteroides sayramensis TaxID=2913411 RepID=UPI001EDB8375|nr:aromatic ring-hydroxylating dioxygenase subunit alpha [Sandaracinobacteroides sayramensis]MCG2842623.1 aromatic ring-hydroxylating dioxygenase subunit alpha [Sandaracinobacteroides sayramensis]